MLSLARLFHVELYLRGHYNQVWIHDMDSFNPCYSAAAKNNQTLVNQHHRNECSALIIKIRFFKRRKYL